MQDTLIALVLILCIMTFGIASAFLLKRSLKEVWQGLGSSPHKEVEAVKETIRLRIIHDIGKVPSSKGPGTNPYMVDMAGEEFDYPFQYWIDVKNQEDYVSYRSYSWLPEWLEEVDSILSKGEEL